MDRRRFLQNMAGLVMLTSPQTLARNAGASPVTSDKKQPQWLTSARHWSGHFSALTINTDLTIHRQIETGHRLHGFAWHEQTGRMALPARRPGRTMLLMKSKGTENPSQIPTIQIESLNNRHFYGHAAFSADGNRLYCTENAYDQETGVIGIYDTQNGQRLGETPSGGIGPHEILIDPDDHLLVANGGILTHPNSGRSKLNLDNMQPSIARIMPNGNRQYAQLPFSFRHLSLRHICQSPDGATFCAMQDQQPAMTDRPLVWRWQNNSISPLPDPKTGWLALRHYIGSVAMDQSGRWLFASAPRANKLAVWDMSLPDQKPALHDRKDVCGLAPGPMADEMLVTSGTGQLWRYKGPDMVKERSFAHLAFDNHAITLSA